MGPRRAGRVIAFQSLYRHETTGEELDGLLDFSWIDDPVSEDTLNFARLLLAGTLERLKEVDQAIRAQLEHWDFARLAKVDLAILRLGGYGLLYQHDVPHSVTIDEAISIAKDFGGPDSYRFINGVLDGIRKGIGRART